MMFAQVLLTAERPACSANLVQDFALHKDDISPTMLRRGMVVEMVNEALFQPVVRAMPLRR
jgi:hypothetical protein